MPFDVRPDLDLSAAETVTLARRDFLIPQLAAAQTRLVVGKLAAIHSIASSDDLSMEQFDAALQLVHAGLLRAYPKLTYDEFLEMPITPAEMLDAVPVVIKQAMGGAARKLALAGAAQGS